MANNGKWNGEGTVKGEGGGWGVCFSSFRDAVWGGAAISKIEEEQDRLISGGFLPSSVRKEPRKTNEWRPRWLTFPGG